MLQYLLMFVNSSLLVHVSSCPSINYKNMTFDIMYS